MTKKELKKLSRAFSTYMEYTESYPAQAVREFWAATFGCNNEAREQELLAYWRAN